ncbi:MAG: acetate--CoA ligase family protein [Deltaproteobacteria bacterium]|nr:acetate--CoA ligase family protein [Deltaproteobacteria bacterium]
MSANANLQALLRPRSVAVVGASPKGSTGGRILGNVLGSGFEGAVYPVNPNYTEVRGKPCFPSIDGLPEVPDCVIVALPVSRVLAVIKEAADAGVPSGIVVAEGFADGDTAAGRRRQEELQRLADAAGMAVTGPCCMGVASLRYGFANSYFSIPPDLTPGGVSLISQSGGLTNAVTELAASRNIGCNYIISSGNEAVVEMADYIEYLADDPETRVIACIMEGAKDGARLRRVLASTGRRKPVVVLKLGRTDAGQRATVAHTGTLAGQREAYEALFRETGVAPVESIDELVETAGLFLHAPLPAGGRVVFLTISGGATALISDVNAAAGLRCPELSAATNARLGEILGVDDRPFSNPIDTVGMPRIEQGTNLTSVLDTLLGDDGIDLVGMALSVKRATAPGQQKLLDQAVACARNASKPLFVLSLASNSLTGDCRTFSADTGVPILEDVAGGMKAVRRLVDYAAFRRREKPSRTPEASVDFRLPEGAGALTEHESKRILAGTGIPMTREELAGTPEQAVEIAGSVGLPVALKVQSPDVPHKSDAGGVALGAATAEEVETAYLRIVRNVKAAHPHARIDGVLVQEMVSDGLEVIVGMVHDAQFGPLVMVGLGGIYVEVFKDAAFRLPPLDGEDVREMLAELRGGALLSGLRGGKPRDVDALVDCVVRFGDFVTRNAGRFTAVEMNPVMVRPEGLGVAVADALITVAAETGQAGRP